MASPSPPEHTQPPPGWLPIPLGERHPALGASMDLPASWWASIPWVRREGRARRAEAQQAQQQDKQRQQADEQEEEAGEQEEEDEAGEEAAAQQQQQQALPPGILRAPAGQLGTQQGSPPSPAPRRVQFSLPAD